MIKNNKTTRETLWFFSCKLHLFAYMRYTAKIERTISSMHCIEIFDFMLTFKNGVL